MFKVSGKVELPEDATNGHHRPAVNNSMKNMSRQNSNAVGPGIGVF